MGNVRAVGGAVSSQRFVASSSQDFDVRPTRASFLELFAGTARLSDAVKELCGDRVEVERPEDIWNQGWDITKDSDFEKSVEVSKRTTWLHGAPPCSTFSRGRAPPLVQLRDDRHPEGWGHPRAEDANNIVRRFVLLIRVAHDAGNL